jgi:hypothetical protein
LPGIPRILGEIVPQAGLSATGHHAGTMAVTQQDIDNLNAAIAKGVRSVTIGGQTVIYNTTESLMKARNDMQAQLNAKNAQGTTRRKKQNQLFQSGRGFE